MVEIKEVKTRRERIEFIRFPKSIYGDCPYWTPDLVFDELETSRPKRTRPLVFARRAFLWPTATARPWAASALF